MIYKMVVKQRRRARMRKNSKRSSKAPTTMALSKRIKRIENEVELKWRDISLGGGVNSTTGILSYLSGISQGTTAVQRIGNKARATSLHFRMQWISNNAMLAPTYCRLIVFWDKQSDGVAPPIYVSGNPSALLDDTIPVLPSVLPYNHNAVQRYRVLYDKTIVLNPQVALSQTNVTPSVTTAVIPVAERLQKKFQLSTILKYSGTSSIITDAESSALFALFLSDTNTNIPTILWGSRLYYKDT